MTNCGDKASDAIIRNFKHGLKSFSQKRWTLASGFQLSVVSVAGAAAVLLLSLIRDRKSGPLSGLPWFQHRNYDGGSEKIYLVPGLHNLGNNCFLNVVLQALASCTYLQPFLEKVIEDCETSATGNGECTESLQLTVALAALLEELCAFGEGRVVLSPRRVMLAMAEYNQDFNLTSQQDAEEAFLHLLSSLREEFSDCYFPNQSSLADAFASSNNRILTPKRREIQNEQWRWQQHFLGPFDGIISSILTCQSCSSQISLNFQFFHSLPLSPVLGSGTTIMVGCTLEDCLKQFVAAERVENYNCSRCWHIGAIKYLTLRGDNETQIEVLKRCNAQDSCTCRSLFFSKTLPSSNNSSHTLKQLNIARSPKILCIHIQRVTVNQFGELVKLQGHIGFPFILNLRPFMLERLQCQKLSPQRNSFNVRSDPRILTRIYGENICSKVLGADGFGCTDHSDTIMGESGLPQSKGSISPFTDASLQAEDEVNMDCQVVPSVPQLYRLVSVVEHFGRAGGGHYTVYRSARPRSEPKNENPDQSLESSFPQWFCISDSKVYSVAEEEVLAAEASLLFYEKIAEA